MSEMLKKARAYEAEKAAQTDKNTRPLFHISAPAGWINDPNGFSVYDGKIHLFYQYYPYAREWGPMHWGHSVTTDMISWEQLPAALAPDQDYDRNGCFSGSAIEADNKHVLVYTGVTKITLPDGREEERQMYVLCRRQSLELHLQTISRLLAVVLYSVIQPVMEVLWEMELRHAHLRFQHSSLLSL